LHNDTDIGSKVFVMLSRSSKSTYLFFLHDRPRSLMHICQLFTILLQQSIYQQLSFCLNFDRDIVMQRQFKDCVDEDQRVTDAAITWIIRRYVSWRLGDILQSESELQHACCYGQRPRASAQHTHVDVSSVTVQDSGDW